MRRDDGCSGHSRGRGRRAPRADPAQRRARAGACYRRRCAACRRSRPGSDRHGVWPRRSHARRGGGSLRAEGPPDRPLGGGAGCRPPGGGVPRRVGAGGPRGSDGPPLAGPLTVVLPRREAPGPRLGGDAGTVGVRCPDHPWLRRLLAAVGPLAVTSANRHAAPTPPEAREVLAALAPAPSAGWSPGSGAHIAVAVDPQQQRALMTGCASGSGATIAVAVDGGPCSGEASTVVAWRKGTLEVLRPGPLRIETPRHP